MKLTDGEDSALDFAASSDPFVRFAIYSSLGALLATAFLFACVVTMRLRLLAHRRRETRWTETWRPLLTGVAINGLDPETDRRLAASPPSDELATRFLLNEWNVLQDCVKGSARTNLVRAGYKLRVDIVAWEMLEQGTSLSDQLLAVVTLGHLGEMGVWNELVKRLDSSNSLLSLMAAKALCNVDPDQAIPLVIERMLSREDWAGARVAGVLLEAGAGAISTPLRDAILAASPDDQEELIQFLPMVYKSVASQVVKQLLVEPDTHDRVIGACLKVAAGPLELPEIRALTDHPRWHIRMRAAAALGRIGEMQDCPRLLHLLADREWWVRYRAAGALARLPFLSRIQLEEMRDQVDDAYGRDMLDQVLAEASFA
jgi:hypothetical protein